MKRSICFIISAFLSISCTEDDDLSSKKTCWSCTQKKVWDKNGLQTIIKFNYEYCYKSEDEIQKIINKLTYSGYEGGGNMESTMTCKKQ